MGFLKGLPGGIVAGLVGAAIWAGISYGTGYEIGWIAWGVGALVGFGVTSGTKGGTPAGMLAAVISILAIMGGKYTAVELVMNKELPRQSEMVEQVLADLKNDEFVVSFLADQVVVQRAARGEVIPWPPGVVPDEAGKQSDYPPEVWSEAISQWNQMSKEDREAYRTEIGDTIRKDIEENFKTFWWEVSKEGFLRSFGALDIVFILLALATAFKIAARRKADPRKALH